MVSKAVPDMNNAGRNKPQARTFLGALLSLVRRGMKAAGDTITRIVFPIIQGAWWSVVPNSRRNYGRYVGDGLSSSVVVAVIMWIVRAFPEAPLKLEKRGGEAIEKHPLLSLIRRPNPFYSGALLWMATLLSYTLNGNAYWLKLRNRGGIPVQLWYLPHYMIEPIGDDKDASVYIKYYEYSPGVMEPIRYLPSDIVHFRFGLDPNNIRKGYGLLNSLLREIFTDDEAANFTATLLYNMGIPGIVVSPKSPDQSPTPQEVEATKTYIQQQFTGDGRGEPLVMAGPTDVQQFGFSPQQMDVKSLRRVPEERVSAVIGVPAIVAGLGAGLDRSTFANYAEAREAAYEQNIIPTQRLLAEEVTNQLLVDFEGVDALDDLLLSFDNSGVRVLQEDQDALVKRANDLVKSGLITVKRGKEMIGEIADDSDNYYLRPMNVIPVSADDPMGEEAQAHADEVASLQAQLDEANANATQNDEAPTPVPGQASLRRLRARSMNNLRRSFQKDVLVTALMRSFTRDYERGVTMMSVSLSALFRDLGRDAQQAYIQTTAKTLVPSASGNGHGKAETTGTGDDADVVNAILADLNVDDWQEEKFGVVYRLQYERILETTVETVALFLNVDMMVDLSDPLMLNVVKTGGKRVGLVDLSAQVRESLFAALHDGRNEGEGPQQIARRIQQYVSVGRFRGIAAERGDDAARRARAMVIARTETKYAQNVSTLVAYEESDVVTGVQAFDNQTGTNDDTCTARNGNTYTFVDASKITNDEHPNGTLSWAPVV